MTNETSALNIIKTQAIAMLRQVVEAETELLTFLVNTQAHEMPLNIAKLEQNITEVNKAIVSINEAKTMEEYTSITNAFFSSNKNLPDQKLLQESLKAGQSSFHSLS